MENECWSFHFSKILLLFSQFLYILMEKVANHIRKSSQAQTNRSSVCEQIQNNNFSNYLVKNATVKYCVASKNIFKRYCLTTNQTSNFKNQGEQQENRQKQKYEQKNEQVQATLVQNTKKQLQNDVYQLQSNQSSERTKTKRQSLVIRQDSISQLYRPVKILNRYNCRQFLVLQKMDHGERVLMKANKHLVRRGNHLINGIDQVQILSNVDHPCVIKLKEVFQNFDKYLLIFEYFQGICLLEYIQKYTITEQIAKIIIKQLLQTLQYLHKKQIIHRDIRAEHIFVSWDEGEPSNIKIKIIDFSYAVSKDKLKNHKKTTTSGAYYRNAPQFLQGIINNKSDLWSVGVLLLVIFLKFSQQSINEGDYIQAILTKNDVYQRHLKNIPEKVSQFINFVMTSKHRRRPSASQALNHIWFKTHSNIRQRLRQKKQQ